MSTAVFIKGSYDVGSRLDLSRADAGQIPVRASLSGLTRAGLAEALVRAEIAPPEKARMRAGQIWRWIHNNGATDFDAMTNIDKATRARLAELEYNERVGKLRPVDQIEIAAQRCGETVLRAIDGMKWDDIAVVCKRTERTVRLRYERARTYLR